jgi:hypothetical protein
MDVYGLPLEKEQASAAAVWIHDEGDGAVSSLRSIMIGWDVSHIKSEPIRIYMLEID